MSPTNIPDEWLDRIPPHQTMLSNRIRKRERHLRRWAKREDIGAYRLYDAAIPEVPLYVDRYNEYLVISWLIPRELRSWDEAPTEHPWLAGMLEAIGETLDTPPERMFVRTRRPTRGQVQYDKVASREKTILVKEHGLTFRVNLSDYVDTGLFLDHRPSRAQVRRDAEGKRVLNLFGYTGAFAVHAAAGGARSTLSLDLSPRYTAWAEENLALNGFENDGRHRAEAVDVMAWLQRDAWQEEPYDIIILDPPTTSRSKRMDGNFDIQRDHMWLLEHTGKLLAPGGVMLFSTNFRRFRPDEEAFAGFQNVEEVTAKSVPQDFPRSRPHRAWWLTRGHER